MPDAKSWRTDFETNFPAYAWVLNEPGVADALSNQNITSADQFQQAIQTTAWWRTTQASLRGYQQLAKQDPASLDQQIRTKDAEVWDLYNQVGLKPSPAEADQMARQAMMFGWDQNQLRDAVVSHMQYSPGIMAQAGQVQNQASQLQQLASEYYTSYPPETYFTWAKQIAAGEHKIEDFTPVIQQQAKSRFSYSPEIMSAIDAGISPKQFFSPYQQEIAKQLEITPEQIDMANNPKWASVMDYFDPNTKVRRPMTLAESQVYARQDDRYQYTRQAQSQGAALEESILNMFGKVSDSGSNNNMAGATG